MTSAAVGNAVVKWGVSPYDSIIWDQKFIPQCDPENTR
jgi:hypothetical protein